MTILKTLIFDVDNSLASIGGAKKAEELFGFPPLRITGGGEQIYQNLQKLFTVKQEKKSHPLFGDEYSEPVVEKTELAKKSGLQCIVIDTLSHAFAQSMRQLEAKNKSQAMEMQDWGYLDRKYWTLLEMIKLLPVVVIVNCHSDYDKDQATGMFYYGTTLKGSTKMNLNQFFDEVYYTKVSKDGKKIYNWQTFADSSKFAKTRVDAENIVAQNYEPILQKYRANHMNPPKFLIIGESGTGKTKSLLTLLNEKPNS